MRHKHVLKWEKKKTKNWGEKTPKQLPPGGKQFISKLWNDNSGDASQSKVKSGK